jgi:hypothetical protein
MDRFNFSTANIYELCEEIVERLNKDGITNDVTLTIPLEKDKFKKVDEDLFYRTKKNDDEEFVPSEGEINVRVENVVLIITENGD